MKYNPTPDQLKALISLAHTASMWEKFGSDTELLDELLEVGPILQNLIDQRDQELIQGIADACAQPHPINQVG